MLVGHVLVLAAALVCLRLGWWQWSVAHASRGTVQNFGYALLWPVFAGSFIYMWLRFLHLESLRDDDAAGEEYGPADPGEPATWNLGGEHFDADGVHVDAANGMPGRTQPIADAWNGSPDGGGLPARAHDSGEFGAGDPAAAGIVEGRARRMPRPDRRHRRPPPVVDTIAVATVGDDDDDPELAAYNEALAALAEQDEHRGR